MVINSSAPMIGNVNVKYSLLLLYFRSEAGPVCSNLILKVQSNAQLQKHDE